MTITREFTENWLQALMMASSNATARKIRPWMTDISLLCASEAVEGQLEAASRLWEYGSNHGLLPWLCQLPSTNPPWRFEDDECFTFRSRLPMGPLSNVNEFVQQLGLVEHSVPLVGTVTQQDWTQLLRREAVRQSKSLSVQAMPAGNLVEVELQGVWDTRSWAIEFVEPAWLRLACAGPMLASRPESDTWDHLILGSLAYLPQGFPKLPTLSQWRGVAVGWMSSDSRWERVHQEVVSEDAYQFHPWIRRVWNSVWPVVYRERHCLRGPCDLAELRKEISECFSAVPMLTEWMFVFARLAIAARCERGLGISADFVDD